MLAFETEEQYPEENLWLSEKCPELATLSPKILKACIAIMPGELRRRMVLMREEAFNLGRDIPGLVALRQISNWYRTNGRAHIVQDHRHLEQLRIRNGDLAGFMTEWQAFLEGSDIELDEDQLEAYFIEKIRNLSVNLFLSIACYPVFTVFYP